MSYSIREMRKEEYSLLSDFLYEAIYIPAGTAAPPKSVITCPELQVYIADFGNSKHDKALIAEVDGNIVGAIWARIMNDYGHIDESTPSLAMSVLKAYRGMGIGTLLLTQMLLAEKAAGYAKISLSVQKDNYAVKLYRKAGFTTVKETTEEYIMVADLIRGKGNPNEENGEYKSSIGLLYGIAFTIKMSYKGTHKIEGFFEYVVPPLEGLWWQENTQGLDYARKADMHFISMIRLPDFVTREDFEWAVQEATKKKKQDFSKVEFFPYDEGLCVQCMHIGSYDDEPATVDLMHDYMKANGYELDITDTRYHHEIYLSDPRKCDVSRLKTVVRHPIRKAE